MLKHKHFPPTSSSNSHLAYDLDDTTKDSQARVARWWDLEAKLIGEASGGKPIGTTNKWSSRKSLSLICIDNGGPRHPTTSIGSSSIVVILSKKECLKSKILVPWRPPLWIYHVGYSCLHNHNPSIFLPRPPKEAWELFYHWLQVRGRFDRALLDHDSRVLVRIGSPLCRDHVLLARAWSARGEDRILDHYCRVSENEVDCARDDTVDEELAVGVDIESVLVG